MYRPPAKDAQQKLAEQRSSRGANECTGRAFAGAHRLTTPRLTGTGRVPWLDRRDAATSAPLALSAAQRQGPWAHDRLGTDLRDGLAEVRRAQPSPQVWQRIADATVDARSTATAPALAVAMKRQRPHEFGLLQPGAWLDLRRLAFIGTVSSLLIAAGLASTSTRLVSRGDETRQVAQADTYRDGFSEAEWRIQPGVSGRAVNRMFPPAPPRAEPATAKQAVLAN